MTAAEQMDSKTRLACQQALQELFDTTVGVTSVALVCTDSRSTICSTSNLSGAEWMGPMATQVYVLSETLGTNAGLQKASLVTIEASNGKLLLLPVMDASKQLGIHRFLLCVQIGPQAILAHLLWSAKNCCQAICEILPNPAAATAANLHAL